VRLSLEMQRPRDGSGRRSRPAFAFRAAGYAEAADPSRRRHDRPAASDNNTGICLQALLVKLAMLE
jgi:hypothetical protein